MVERSALSFRNSLTFQFVFGDEAKNIPYKIDD